MIIGGSSCWGFGADGDAEGDLLKEAEADLAKGTAAIVPIYYNDFIGLVRDATDLVEDDKMGREAAPEFVVTLFVQIGIVDIYVREAGLQALGEVGKEIWDMGSEEVGAGGLDVKAEHVVDDAVKFTVVDSGPECIFGAGVEVAEK